MKQDKEIEQARRNLEKSINQTYKPNFWNKFKDFVGMLFIAIFLLIGIIGIIVLFITLIENPLSLAVLCGTVLLITIWMTK